MRFTGRRSNNSGESFVEHHWTQDVPLFVQAMVLADKRLFIAGPPNFVDEAATFRPLTAREFRQSSPSKTPPWRASGVRGCGSFR